MVCGRPPGRGGRARQASRHNRTPAPGAAAGAATASGHPPPRAAAPATPASCRSRRRLKPSAGVPVVISPLSGPRYLSFNLNLNLPPPCTTGYLPAQQARSAVFEDYPDLPAGNLYCRVPQDSPFNVRGARNIPCETRPGKRAPTVAMCESDEQYVPLNDGYNWKGDPNAMMSGQDIPQLPPGSATPEQSAAAPGPGEKTWQSMLLPATPG